MFRGPFLRVERMSFFPVLTAGHVRLFRIGVLRRLFFPEPFQGNGDGKNSFPVGDAGDGDGSVVGFHGAFHNGEAQARSPDFRGVVGFHPVKAAEEEGMLSAGMPTPVSVTVMTQASCVLAAATVMESPGSVFCLRAFSTKLNRICVQ